MQSARTITVVGCHAEGEVGRVIIGGVLPPPGNTLVVPPPWPLPECAYRALG